MSLSRPLLLPHSACSASGSSNESFSRRVDFGWVTRGRGSIARPVGCYKSPMDVHATAPPGAAMNRLVLIMDQLLAPGGCPWDREQTLETLRPFLVEETYEVLDALSRGDVSGHL